MWSGLQDRLVTRRYKHRQYESLALREHFRTKYDIEVGLYSYGCFDRWRIPVGSRIGRWCSFANTARFIDGNHPLGSASLHPFFYEPRWGIVPAMRAHVVAPVIEDDVWVGHGAIGTASCNHVGRGAVIGAGAIVTRDVPAYAVVAGNPARVLKMRFDDATIEAVEASRWWDESRETLAAVLAEDDAFLERPSRETAAVFREAVERLSPPRRAAGGPAAPA